MPRRKRTTPQNEGRRKVRRTDTKDEETLVISDSENEEEEDSVDAVSLREARLRERESRVQMQDMTEEEMLDLAMRLSKQEANSAAQRQQLEDDDMRKAIEESLHVSQSLASDLSSDSASCMKKPSQDSATVMPRLRRKLTFLSKTETTRAGDRVTDAAESDEDSMQGVGPLSPMPDLSQRSLSQPSPPSPGLPPVPSTSSKEWASTQSEDQNKQVPSAASPKGEPSQSDFQDSVKLQQCSVTLGLDLKSPSRASRNLLSTQGSSLSFTCPDGSHLPEQQSPSPPKSPIFAKTDPKQGTELSDNKISCCMAKDNFSDKVGVSKEDDDHREHFEESPSHKNQLQQSRDPRKRLSLYRKSQPSPHVSAPDDDVDPKQVAAQSKRLKNDSSQGTSLNAILERVPGSKEVPLPVDSKSLEEFSSHMILHLSDDENDEEEERVVAQSPVFHQEFVPHPDHPRLSPTQSCCSLSTAITTQDCSCTCSHSTQDPDSQHSCVQRTFPSGTACPANSKQLETGVQDKPACDFRPVHPIEGKGHGLVSYYWGIPFCPKGQSPDDYTRVILSQLEVYEKSLKEAQRQLLHKAEWGLPLFPCPAERQLGKRMKRHRAPQPLEEEEEEELERKVDEKMKEEGSAESQADSDEASEHREHETYVVVSSPETQEEHTENSSSLLWQQESTGAVRSSSCRKSSPHDLSEDTQIQQPEEHEDIPNEHVESMVCPETQMTEDDTPELMVTSPAQPQSRTESEVMEVDEEEAADDEGMEQEQIEEEQQQMGSVAPPNQKVECPMCSRLFPISKIEVHAAFCDGTTEEAEQQEDLSQVVALRKRNRRIAVEETRPGLENRSEQREKCYVCLKSFSTKDYTHHVDKCLQLKGPKSNQGNGLLSALQQAEQVHLDDDDDGAGPSDVTFNNSGLADSSLLAESGGKGVCPVSRLHISSSPIKSFTPISEATDCLIDFQQQYSARSSQRLGRKRKFKR